MRSRLGGHWSQLGTLRRNSSKSPAEVPASGARRGFDDIPIARFVAPPLTTVWLAIADLSAHVIERLFWGCAGAEERAVQ